MGKFNRLVLFSLLIATIEHILPASGSGEFCPRQIMSFDIPDLAVTVKSDNGEVQLEAYKSVSNDQINNLKEGRLSDRQSQLFWVSIGIPTLMRTSLKGTNLTLFHKDFRGFFTAIEMLTLEQRQILAQAATEKYGVKIQSKQIVHLVLSKFECKINLYEDGKNYIISGKVGEFRKFPLRLHFRAELGTIERKLFEQIEKKEEPFEIECFLATQGKEIQSNTLVISANEVEALGLTNKIFGTNTNNKIMYITREQLKILSLDMYSSLHIAEKYHMSYSQFSDAFINDLVEQTADMPFNLRPFNDVMEGISRIGIDGTDRSVTIEDIKRDYHQLFYVSRENNVTSIGVYKKWLPTRENGPGSIFLKPRFPWLLVLSSINFVESHEKEWAKGLKN